MRGGDYLSLCHVEPTLRRWSPGRCVAAHVKIPGMAMILRRLWALLLARSVSSNSWRGNEWFMVVWMLGYAGLFHDPWYNLVFSQGQVQAFKTWLKGWRLSRASWNSRFLKSEQVAFRVPCAISALTSSPCESSGCGQSSAFAHQWWRGEDCFNVWKSFRGMICPSCLPWFEADVLTDFDDQPVVIKDFDSFRLVVSYPSNPSDLWWIHSWELILNMLSAQQHQQGGTK